MRNLTLLMSWVNWLFFLSFSFSLMFPGVLALLKWNVSESRKTSTSKPMSIDVEVNQKPKDWMSCLKTTSSTMNRKQMESQNNDDGVFEIHFLLVYTYLKELNFVAPLSWLLSDSTKNESKPMMTKFRTTSHQQTIIKGQMIPETSSLHSLQP